MPPLLLEDTSTGSTARIAPELGFNCFEFQANLGGRLVDVIDAAPEFAEGNERPSGHGIPILFPFPNRIREGRFSWNGIDYEIPSSTCPYDATDNAIHGFCLDRPWRVVEQGQSFAVGQFRLSQDAPDRLDCWPADFLIEVRYELRGTTLRCDVRIANPDDKPLPWGFGTHPYFRLPLDPHSAPARCLVQASAAELWELTDCLPTGNRLPVGEGTDLRDGEYFDCLKLDDVLTNLAADDSGRIVESVLMDEQAGLQVSQRFDTTFRELVVFTPPGRNAVCLEPYTCVTDALNLQESGVDAGWNVLPPGEEFRTWIEIAAELVLA
jgi:aldose 1-epimerase